MTKEQAKAAKLEAVILTIFQKTRSIYTLAELPGIVRNYGRPCHDYQVQNACQALWKEGHLMHYFNDDGVVCWKLDPKKHPTDTGVKQQSLL